MWTVPLRLVLLAASLMLMGCQTKPPTASVVTKGADFCKVAQPILYSKDDTEGTKKQVREHNDVGVVLCKW